MSMNTLKNRNKFLKFVFKKLFMNDNKIYTTDFIYIIEDNVNYIYNNFSRIL